MSAFVGGDVSARHGAAGHAQTADLDQKKGHDLPDVSAFESTRVNEVVVLICGHGGRDSRCGGLGLPLQAEFEEKLSKASFEVLPRQRRTQTNPALTTAHVGLTSHIGGHKWAGNIIIYIPPSWRTDRQHPLGGMALWYGRVEPKHVEGIVRGTIIDGRVIRELWRGGMRLSDPVNGSSWEPVTEVSL